MNLIKIEELLVFAYESLTKDDDTDTAIGCIAEALARVQGDTGSFDNQEGV